ncbi:hypothetical protein M2S00_02745 [Apilactobacillus sp. TMW 2.2459]|uniref:hypothetical protein n=1 Tax=Apilactobacillus xinyiensis TaxID=2841032 RepID=UPI00200D828C|nr:hypothetical protein [Apilactobacillus xinyiensis]MCL0312017.1 hypothetical protein [Apilactobacillus xinyiensis]
MNKEQLIKIAEAFKKYNIDIEFQDLTITAINHHPATLNAADYMPNQMVELICKFMQTQIISDMWQF